MLRNKLLADPCGPGKYIRLSQTPFQERACKVAKRLLMPQKQGIGPLVCSNLGRQKPDPATITNSMKLLPILTFWSFD